jgi:hypothetical protein
LSSVRALASAVTIIAAPTSASLSVPSARLPIAASALPGSPPSSQAWASSTRRRSATGANTAAARASAKRAAASSGEFWRRSSRPAEPLRGGAVVGGQVGAGEQLVEQRRGGREVLALAREDRVAAEAVGEPQAAVRLGDRRRRGRVGDVGASLAAVYSGGVASPRQAVARLSAARQRVRFVRTASPN